MFPFLFCFVPDCLHANLASTASLANSNLLAKPLDLAMKAKVRDFEKLVSLAHNIVPLCFFVCYRFENGKQLTCLIYYVAVALPYVTNYFQFPKNSFKQANALTLHDVARESRVCAKICTFFKKVEKNTSLSLGVLWQTPIHLQASMNFRPFEQGENRAVNPRMLLRIVCLPMADRRLFAFLRPFFGDHDARESCWLRLMTLFQLQ